MSTIIKFFVAPDDAVAASVAKDGPGRTLESVTYGNFDVYSTLEEWESLLTARDLDEVADSGGPDIVFAENDAPLVLAVPHALAAALADADGPALSNLAERWIGLRAEDGETVDDALARELIGEVAGLVVRAAQIGGSVYCWVC